MNDKHSRWVSELYTYMVSVQASHVFMFQKTPKSCKKTKHYEKYQGMRLTMYHMGKFKKKLLETRGNVSWVVVLVVGLLDMAWVPNYPSLSSDVPRG